MKYNEELAGEYLKHLTAMADKFGLDNDIKVSTLSRYPDVFTMEQVETDENELWAGLEKALRGAAEQFVESRIKEGEHLKNDLCAKLDNMLNYVDFIEERSPIIMKYYRERLENKVKELLEDKQIDDARIATEVTIFADKICTDEETVRLMIQMEIDGIYRKLSEVQKKKENRIEGNMQAASYFEMVPASIAGETMTTQERECGNPWLCSMIGVLFGAEMCKRRCRHRRCEEPKGKQRQSPL